MPIRQEDGASREPVSQGSPNFRLEIRNSANLKKIKNKSKNSDQVRTAIIFFSFCINIILFWAVLGFLT